jgi:transcriptional regulator with XRE-family HTH domain
MKENRTEDWVGPNLKKTRAQAGLSLTRTAELTEVSKAMLGQIERGESSPTLVTLWKICKGLHLPLTALIGPSGAAPVYGPNPDTVANRVKNAPSFKTLFPFDPKTGCEVFLHDLSPHWEHQSDAHRDGVIEDVFVTEGAVDILVGTDWVRVPTGGALRFNADQPHGYRNPLDTPSAFHNTIHYPAQLEKGM